MTNWQNFVSFVDIKIEFICWSIICVWSVHDNVLIFWCYIASTDIQCNYPIIDIFLYLHFEYINQTKSNTTMPSMISIGFIWSRDANKRSILTLICFTGLLFINAICFGFFSHRSYLHIFYSTVDSVDIINVVVQFLPKHGSVILVCLDVDFLLTLYSILFLIVTNYKCICQLLFFSILFSNIGITNKIGSQCIYINAWSYHIKFG